MAVVEYSSSERDEMRLVSDSSWRSDGMFQIKLDVAGSFGTWVSSPVRARRNVYYEPLVDYDIARFWPHP
jgi:hypothetical protein